MDGSIYLLMFDENGGATMYVTDESSQEFDLNAQYTKEQYNKECKKGTFTDIYNYSLYAHTFCTDFKYVKESAIIGRPCTVYNATYKNGDSSTPVVLYIDNTTKVCLKTEFTDEDKEYQVEDFSFSDNRIPSITKVETSE